LGNATGATLVDIGLARKCQWARGTGRVEAKATRPRPAAGAGADGGKPGLGKEF